MKFRELIKRVQAYSGFSDEESRDSLECLVETLAVHLTEAERKEFAAQLPEELQDIALAVLATERNSRQDILEQFMENQHVEESRAQQQLTSAWQALREALSPGEIRHIRAQLPSKTGAFFR